MKNKYKHIDKNLVIKDYVNNVPIAQIIKIHSISVPMLYRWLEKFQIKRERTVRKYYYNEQYFKEIDTADKAYFLGWFYSDGNNYSPSWRSSIKIQENDKYILEIFSNYISNGIIPLEYIKKKERKKSSRNKI